MALHSAGQGPGLCVCVCVQLCNVPELGAAKTRPTETAAASSKESSCCCCCDCVIYSMLYVTESMHMCDQCTDLSSFTIYHQRCCACAPIMISRKINDRFLCQWLAALLAVACGGGWKTGKEERYHTKSRGSSSVSSQLTSFYFSHEWDMDWGRERIAWNEVISLRLMRGFNGVCVF